LLRPRTARGPSGRLHGRAGFGSLALPLARQSTTATKPTALTSKEGRSFNITTVLTTVR